MKRLKKILPVFAAALVFLIFTASLLIDGKRAVTASGFAMGSPVSVTVYDKKSSEDYCKIAIDRIKYIDDNFLSHTGTNSAVYRLNRGESVENTRFANYLKECEAITKDFEGFTLFSGDYKALWKIESGGYVPTENELLQVAEKHKNARLFIEGNKISVENGVLDLGALGKGTACDEALDALREIGIDNALVTVGGTVGAMGSPDTSKNFTIGVRNPFGSQNDYFATLKVTDCFISTSGDYEKYFISDGVRYSHIFNANTGTPVQNDISSVTVIAKSGVESDFLSTLIYIEGVDKAFEIANGFDADIIIVKKDKSVLISKALEDAFTLTDNSFSVSVIE